MIKKILILAILGGLGYVGYLVWQNLTPKEKDVVAKKAGDVVDGAKDLASKAASRAVVSMLTVCPQSKVLLAVTRPRAI